VKQVAVADRIVLTKLDLLTGKAGEDALFAIIARLRKLNPSARLLTTHRGEATAERLFNTGLYDPAKKSADVQACLNIEQVERAERGSGPRGHRHAHGHDHHHGHDHEHNHGHEHDVSRHDDHIRSFAFRESRPISPQGLEMFLELLLSYHGPNLLRMKGVVLTTDNPQRPVAIHAVQHVIHPPVRLEGWGGHQPETRLVFIVKDIGKPVIEGLFKAFVDQLSGQGAAMTDKTLSLT
jgi:G3E family GTPase